MVSLGEPQALDSTTLVILAEQPFLRRLAGRLTHCSPDADDLVQETLLRAYLARDRFADGTSIRAWLATILRRLFLTAASKDRRRNTPTDTDAGEPLTLAGGPAAPSRAPVYLPYDELMERVDDDVRAAFLALPDVYRVPFVLFALEGFTYAEVAETLRVPVGTVMSRIHRARGRLKRGIEAAGADLTGPAGTVAGEPSSTRRLACA